MCFQRDTGNTHALFPTNFCEAGSPEYLFEMMHFLVLKLSGGGKEGGEERKGFVLFSAFKSEFSLVKSVPIKGNEIPPAFMSFLFCPHNKKTLDYYFTVKMLVSMAATKEY